jgi:hypothetical protein
MTGEEGKECMRAYSAILASLQKYEETHREEWAHEIDAQVCAAKGKWVVPTGRQRCTVAIC